MSGYGIIGRLLIALGVAVGVWIFKSVACAVALRVHAGTRPLPVDADELTWRSALAGAGLTLVTPLEILALDDVFTVGLNSVLFWLLVVSLVPLGGAFLNWIYALDDYLPAVGVFMLYSVFPVLALLVCRLAHVPVRSLMLRIL